MSKANEEVFTQFCKVIRDTIDLFDDLIAFENKKLDAVAANDIKLLDQCMNEEQVFLLKMRGFDAKRETLQELLGFAEQPFSKMIQEWGGPEKASLRQMYEDLSVKSAEVKDVIATTKKYIDLNMNSIQTLLERLESSTGVYDQKGEKVSSPEPPTRFTPTKV